MSLKTPKFLKVAKPISFLVKQNRQDFTFYRPNFHDILSLIFCFFNLKFLILKKTEMKSKAQELEEKMKKLQSMAEGIKQTQVKISSLNLTLN